MAPSAPGYLARNEDSLIWIFGSSRSGSTWLLKMLSEHDAVVPMDDPHLGQHLGVWRPIPLAWAAAGDFPPELARLDEIKDGKPDYFFCERHRDVWLPALKRFILSRFDAQLEDFGSAGPGDQVLLVKEPGSQAAELLLTMFPTSGLIFLLRDGRDVVDSWLDAYSDGAWAQEEGAFPVAPSGRLPFIRWQASVWLYRTEAVQRAYGAHPPSRRVLVRYEELLAEPARELERICSTFGLVATRDRLTEIVQMHSFANLPRASTGPGKAARAARPGGWRKSMNSAEQDAMLEIMGAKLDELGYLDSRDRHRLASLSLAERPRAA